MLSRADLDEILARYHGSEIDSWSREQAVFDLGRLLGHVMAQACTITALENELAAAEMAGDALEASLREANARLAAAE